MAPRSLSSTWRSFERLLNKYVASDPPAQAVVDDLVQLAEKVNASRIIGALSYLFITPYTEMEETQVAFLAPEGGKFPDWPIQYDEEADLITINPYGVYLFCRLCAEAPERLKTPEARANFPVYRYHAYLAELAKLPNHYILFLILLNQVAKHRRIHLAEKKSGGTEPPDNGIAEGREYMNLLWAFKELEVFYRNTNGLSMRVEYGILWQEADWFGGKK